VKMAEVNLSGETVKKIEELVEELTQVIGKLKTGEERVTAALTALSMILEKSGLTMMEQAALLKFLDIFFSWGAKETCDRALTPLGVM